MHEIRDLPPLPPGVSVGALLDGRIAVQGPRTRLVLRTSDPEEQVRIVSLLRQKDGDRSLTALARRHGVAEARARELLDGLPAWIAGVARSSLGGNGWEVTAVGSPWIPASCPRLPLERVPPAIRRALRSVPPGFVVRVVTDELLEDGHGSVLLWDEPRRALVTLSRRAPSALEVARLLDLSPTLCLAVLTSHGRPQEPSLLARWLPESPWSLPSSWNPRAWEALGLTSDERPVGAVPLTGPASADDADHAS